jgi:hypothetical protein
VRNAYFNLTTAPSQGPGLYALMASVQIPLHATGWNLFAYPLPLPLPVNQALLSIDGFYSTVYGYLAEDPDPWKLFQVDGPPYLNSLTDLEPGRGYWISVTQPITVHMSNPSAATLLNATWPASPPDTFYGPVLAGPSFTPTPGMDLVAYVDDIPCGHALLQDYNGETVYVVHVDADDATERSAGCGQPGRPVSFYVDGQLLAPTASWDNRQLNWLPLAPRGGWQLFLPLIIRNH